MSTEIQELNVQLNFLNLEKVSKGPGQPQMQIQRPDRSPAPWR